MNSSGRAHHRETFSQCMHVCFCVCLCVCVHRGAQHTSLEQCSPPQSNTPGTPPSYKLPPLLGNYEGKDDFPLRKTGRGDKPRPQLCLCVLSFAMLLRANAEVECGALINVSQSDSDSSQKGKNKPLSLFHKHTSTHTHKQTYTHIHKCKCSIGNRTNSELVCIDVFTGASSP